MVSSTEGRVLKKANPNTIQDKFLVGYQGWFTCPGDGPPVHIGHHGWLHWFNVPIPDGGRPHLDTWPDVSEYSPSELFPAPGLTMQDGRPAQLFSSRHPKTVERHFHWMAMHNVDGAFLQRFAGQCEVDGRTEGTNADIMRLRDEVGDRVREAAEKEGRVWAIMYDVSGVPADRIEKVIRVDWEHLMRDKGILDSPNYLREDGRPVIALWGFGFAGRGHNPDVVRSIVRHIKANTPGGAYVMAGAPTHWQTLKGDADPNEGFLPVWYNEFDAISPWTVGRYHNEETVDRFAKEKIQKDIEALKNNAKSRKVDYIPVVFPGGSGFNLSQGKWGLNEMARDGGRFLWRQLYNARKAGVRTVYGAMWDEYDEGTSFLPVVSKKRELPSPGAFLALDADGYDLPPDWYMRISGFAGEILRGERTVHETFPVKDLQDYWSSRPKYEPLPIRLEPSASSSSSSAGPSGSAGGVEMTYEEWCEQEKEGKDDLPPPPYTLEQENAATPTGAPAEGSSSQIQGSQQRQQTQPTLPGQAPPAQRPPVPTQSRPTSLPVDSSPYPAGRRPNSQGAQEPGLNLHSSPGTPQLQYVNGSTSLPSSPPLQQAHLHPQGARRPGGPVPGEIFYHPQPPLPPQRTRPPPQQPPWNSRPQQQSYARPQAQGSLSLSVSELNGQFGRQSLSDAPSPSTQSMMQNPYSPQNVGNQADARWQQPQPPRPTAGPQWPPPEWGMQSLPSRPASLSPANQPQRPPTRPPTHPPTAPHPGHYGPPSPSTSPYPPSSPGPAPGQWDYNGTAAFPEPGSGSASYASYGPPPMPPRRRQSASSVDPPLLLPSVSTYPSMYPDAAQPAQAVRNDYLPEPGTPGGFYAGPPHARYPAPGPGPVSTYPPPPVPPRRTGPPAPVSVSPGQIMPGGTVPGRLGGVASNAYAYTLGAVDKVAGAGTRRRVEDGVGTMSTAGSKVYQNFRR